MPTPFLPSLPPKATQASRDGPDLAMDSSSLQVPTTGCGHRWCNVLLNPTTTRSHSGAACHQPPPLALGLHFVLPLKAPFINGRPGLAEWMAIQGPMRCASSTPTFSPLGPGPPARLPLFSKPPPFMDARDLVKNGAPDPRARNGESRSPYSHRTLCVCGWVERISVGHTSFLVKVELVWVQGSPELLLSVREDFRPVHWTLVVGRK